MRLYICYTFPINAHLIVSCFTRKIKFCIKINNYYTSFYKCIIKISTIYHITTVAYTM